MSLIVSGRSPIKGDYKVYDIKTSILDRGNRKYWYLRYQVFYENDDIKIFEESTRVLKSEKTLKYMQTKYLPAWLARKEEELKMQKYISCKFSYFYEKYLKQHEEDKSYHNRIYIYRKVNDFFKDFDVNKITRLVVKEYIATLNIQDKTKKDYLGCIKGVLDIALDAEIIHKNVATDIVFKREPKNSVQIFSPQEVNLLLEKSDGMLKNYLGIAFYTGMRSGEILGLMHKDMLNDRICIRRSISKGRVTTPKTLGSVRDIPIFDNAKTFIRDQQALNKSKSLYLFEYGSNFLKDISYFKRQWKRLVHDCNIDYRKIYSTRHTFITMMLNSGKFQIMDIAAIVGHTSPQMIMANYAGFIKDSHLKVNTNVDLFENGSDTFSDTSKFKI